jgi:hypothetical protein
VVIVKLLDPFGGLVEPFANADLECGVVAIVFDVSLRWDTEGVFIVFDLFIEAGDGVVKGGDGSLMGLFPRLDHGGEEVDDVDEESGAAVVEISFSSEGSATWGYWFSNKVWVVEHCAGPEKSKGFTSSLGRRGCFNSWDHCRFNV